ncbi:MAG: ThiF family adenylyltransferase, partial [Pseudomonadales bacterium]|nr:ThiF family adenylyltransferase [Pseudomonadales bacterium]
GQVAVFDSRQGNKPCYRCLYKEEGDELDLNCSRNGVMAPLAGIVGSVQAMEAIKVIAELGEPLVGKLLVLDGMNMQWRNLRLPKDPDCPVCG